MTEHTPPGPAELDLRHDEEGLAEAAEGTTGTPGVAPRSGGEVPLLSNAQLATMFHEIGDLLEVKGELVF
ncbi:MAG TPA: hypothetical protein VET90_08145, partial [Candidatus Binatus sp.]|nr:hypothetical protein [Candidatus Binatus sp.]